VKCVEGEKTAMKKQAKKIRRQEGKQVETNKKKQARAKKKRKTYVIKIGTRIIHRLD
jgi:hypothetical protein